MTDQEITNIIAAKVMGWNCPDTESLPNAPRMHNSYCMRCAVPECDGEFSNFSPLCNDRDCMAAWDRLVEMVQDLEIDEPNTETETWEDRVGYIMSNCTGLDRRRAMCLCMCEAVGEPIS